MSQPILEVEATKALKDFLYKNKHRGESYEKLCNLLNYPDLKIFLKEIWPLLEAENVEDESYNKEILQA